MAITEKSIKILWSASGGRCAFPGCWTRLCFHEAEQAAPHTLGEMAHICGEKLGSNRHNPNLTVAERDDYQNLILLCPTHHTLIDRRENEAVYTVVALNEMKVAHELRVLDRLNKGSMQNKEDVARIILPLLEENRQSWAQYGPLSALAQAQPYSKEAHAVWVSERLSVIVPNNRRIVAEISPHKALFTAEEQEVVTAFILHVRSYEQWVEDLIPYSAVKRFPKNSMI